MARVWFFVGRTPGAAGGGSYGGGWEFLRVLGAGVFGCFAGPSHRLLFSFDSGALHNREDCKCLMCGTRTRCIVGPERRFKPLGIVDWLHVSG